MEGTTQCQADGAIAIPAQLGDAGLEASQRDGQVKACFAAAGVDHHIGIATGSVRQGKAHTQSLGDRGTRRIAVDQLHAATGDATGQPRGQQPDTAAPDHAHFIARPDLGIPHGIDRRLEVGGEHRALRGNVIGQPVHGRSRHDVMGLVGMQAKHACADQPRNATDHAAHAGIAVLDRCGKLARLERCAHALVFAHGHGTVEHQRFGAAAHATEQRLYNHFFGRRRAQRFATQFTAAGLGNPESSSVVDGHS